MCHSTTYKILTSVLAEQTYAHINSINLFPIKMIHMNLIHTNIKINCFLTILSWQIVSVDIKCSLVWLQESHVIQYFVQLNMTLSNIHVFLSHSSGVAKPSNIKINNGIFQVDSSLLSYFVLLLFQSNWNILESRKLVSN